LKVHHNELWTALGFNLQRLPPLLVVCRRRKKWLSGHPDDDAGDALMDKAKEKCRRMIRVAKISFVLIWISILMATALILRKIGMLVPHE
jgi:hypothetical protein